MAPDELERAEVLVRQVEDVTEGGWVYLWVFAERRFEWVRPNEACSLCWTGRGSIQQDLGAGSDVPPPRNRPRVYAGSPRFRRVSVVDMDGL